MPTRLQLRLRRWHQHLHLPPQRITSSLSALFRPPGKKIKVVRGDPVDAQIRVSDDDFVSPPLAFLTRLELDPLWNDVDAAPGGGPDADLCSEEEPDYPTVKFRAQASALVDALVDLSTQQKDGIRSLGFGPLLDFKVSECPPRLLHWLLTNFDGQTRTFDLGGGRSISVNERDVELVLGFPRGHIEMVKRDKHQISNLLKHWRGLFEKVRHTVTVSRIADKVIAEVDGGIWFKRHFAMLVVSTLVCCMSNGYANQMYFHCFDDVGRIRDLNWCKLLLDSLVESQGAWKTGDHRCFVGPAEFVALFYVDRVLPFERSVPRVLPSFRGWTFELLLARECAEISGGGFGRGVIEPPMVEVPSNSGNEDCVEFGPKTFECVVGEVAAVFASCVSSLSQFFVMARGRAMEGEVCRQLFAPIQPRLDVLGADFRVISEGWGCNDVPSFNLGLTQDFAGGDLNVRAPDAVNALGNNSAAEYMDPEVGNVCTEQAVLGAAEKGAALPESSDQRNVDVASGLGDCPMSDCPGFTTPAEGCLTGNGCSDPTLSAGPVCGAPAKAARPMKPPGSSVMAVASRLEYQASGVSVPVTFPLPDLPEDALIVNWLLGGSAVDMAETIFCVGERIASWESLLSLTPGSQVDVGVIDAWAAVLNRREATKPRAAPSRLFASTFTTLSTVVDTSQSVEKRLAWFSERLMMDLALSPYEDICEIDMLFFPILRRGHYFLLCFDFPRFRYEIIDNDSYPMAKSLKYGDSVEDLQGMLSKFYEHISPERSAACVCVCSKRLQMRWRDSKNKIDCGVFMMRHMESYLGQRVPDWDCGLVKGDITTLHKLRLRYMKELVVFDHNVHRSTNLSRAYQSIEVPLPSM